MLAKAKQAFSNTTTSAPSASKVDKIQEYVESLINQNHIVVFSKSYCPYCHGAKRTLEQLGVNAVVIELDEVDIGSSVQAYIRNKYGHRTVPAIFVDGQLIGGYSEFNNALQNGLKL